MATLQQQAKGKKDGEIRYLTPLNIETNKTKKYCRFKISAQSGSCRKKSAPFGTYALRSRFIKIKNQRTLWNLY